MTASRSAAEAFRTGTGRRWTPTEPPSRLRSTASPRCCDGSSPRPRRAPIDHAWAGVLGVPRDWSATVGLDRASGLGWAGGYVGTGVTATNLAGRTLRDLVLGHDTELTRLPWSGHRSRKWEIEPLRWLAVQGIYAAYRAADRAEFRGRPTTSPLARVADLVAGR